MGKHAMAPGEQHTHLRKLTPTVTLLVECRYPARYGADFDSQQSEQPHSQEGAAAEA